MTEIAPVSVCMATFNGARFVVTQIESILAQIDELDELIIVDDASTDGTLSLLRALDDPRIRVTGNAENLGYVRTFEKALSQAKGQHIFLADQDDVWPPGRVHRMQLGLRHASLVAGNIAVLEGPPRIKSPFGARDWKLNGDPARHPLPWLVRLAMSNAPYFGSAMAVDSDLLELALPFPPSVQELHDGWLALLGLMSRSIKHVPDRVVLRRLHDTNTSGRRRHWRAVARGRILFVRMCWDARHRARRLRQG
jgi:glycosyltransferase involved in cell wall biosynthesis